MHTHSNTSEFAHLSNQALVEDTRDFVSRERQMTVEVLRRLREIESRKIYLELAYPSLFEFAVHALGYSESAAQRRIAAMRLLKEIPAAEAKIETGELSLSVIARAQTFFLKEARADAPVESSQKEEILNSLAGKSARDAEKTLLSHASQPETHLSDRVRQVTELLSEIRVFADGAWMDDIEKLRGLLANKFPGPSISDALKEATRIALAKLDPAREPLRKKQNRDGEQVQDKVSGRAGSCDQKQTEMVGALPTSVVAPPAGNSNSLPTSVVTPPAGESNLLPTSAVAPSAGNSISLPTSAVAPSAENSNSLPTSAVAPPAGNSDSFPVSEKDPFSIPKNRHIPMATRRAVFQESDGRCTYIHKLTGRVCGSRVAPQMDHLLAYALGGSHEMDNLRVLCARHHRFRTEREQGFKRK